MWENNRCKDLIGGGWGFPSTGHELGGRDHTTAMHANDKILKEVDNNESIKQEIDLIRQRLYIP